MATNTSNSSTALAGALLLVVDDDPLVLSAVKRLLTGAGASVLTAAAGEQAISVAAGNAVGLLLTDIEMPGLDGRAVATAVQAVVPGVRIVFMSGRPREFHIANGRLTEDDLLVGKPFSGRGLVETLVNALAGAPP